MQFDYLCTSVQENKARKLILFFAGWGMDPAPFRHLTSDSCDVIMFYNYRKLGFGECVTTLQNLFHNYSQISIIAYSLGVWGASTAFEKFTDSLSRTLKASEIKQLLKKLDQCIAINGTLFPISSTWGIPQEIFSKTIENLPQGLDKFNLRMCGSLECYNRYKNCLPEREVIQIKEELIAIEENMIVTNSLKWDHALISDTDYIFPTLNQRTFWEDYQISGPPLLKISTVPGGHFPFFIWNHWEEILHFNDFLHHV